MNTVDAAVIGAGPGGYVAAIRAAQLGLKVALVDKGERLGGTCLNVGCIPSKALLESSERYAAVRHELSEHGITIKKATLDMATMMARKDKAVIELTDGLRILMKKHKIAVLRGTGSLSGPGRVAVKGEKDDTTIGAKAIILATGSVPIELPFMPFDGERIVTSTEALAFPKVPGHLVVVGAGAVGLELGSVWCRLGARVTVVELLPRIVPFADSQMSTLLMRSLKQQGIAFKLACQVAGASVAEHGVTLSVKDAKGGGEEIACDTVLVAVGRRPFSDGLGLEGAGVETDDHGRVKVDDRFATTAPGVYAIGDLIAGPMLAHKAQEEGVAVAEILAGRAGHVNYGAVPSVVYTRPELAQVGLTEDEAKEKGIGCRIGKFFMKGNGRAKCMGETDGMVKVIADAKTDRVLGIHILSAFASELVAEAVTALEFQASAEDLARIVHAHPTLSESLKEAALAVDKRAIHG